MSTLQPQPRPDTSRQPEGRAADAYVSEDAAWNSCSGLAASAELAPACMHPSFKLTFVSSIIDTVRSVAQSKRHGQPDPPPCPVHPV